MERKVYDSVGMRPRRGLRGDVTTALALVSGLALRALFVRFHPLFVGDSQMYADIAQNLLRHHIYGVTDNGIQPTLIRLPGYPLFLAAVFALFGEGNLLAAVWIQVMLDLLGCLLLACLAARLFGRRTATITLWLAVLCPFTANYTATPLTETGSVFCVTAAFWALAAWRDAVLDTRTARSGAPGYAALTGCALAGAVLLRPDGGLLAAAVVPVMLWVAWKARGPGRRLAVTGSAMASLVVLLCLGGWTLRNWHVFHVFQPLAPKYANDPNETSMAGFGRWYRTWATGYGDTMRVYWTYDGAPLVAEDLPVRAFDSDAQKQETERLIRRYNVRSEATPEIEAAFQKIAEERVRAHPVRTYLALPLARLADMWLRPRTELLKVPLDWWQIDRRPKAASLAIAFGLLNLSYLLAAVLGLRRWAISGWGQYGAVAAAAVGFVVCRSLLLMTIDNSEPRYTLECYPVVLLLAAVAFAGHSLKRSAAPEL